MSTPAITPIRPVPHGSLDFSAPTSSTPRILTHRDTTRFAPVDCWVAYDAADYDGDPRTLFLGRGATEAEALADYHEQVAAALVSA